jgi:ATP/maltotriose-dependent transcriptional regulator MalT
LAAQAIAVLRQNPAPLDLPFVLLQHADYLREQQRPAEALPLVQEALTAAQHLQHESLQMRASALAADLSVRLDEAEAAHAYAEAAHLLLSQLEPYPDTLEGVLHLGRYQLARGNQEAAAKIGTFVANHPASTYGVCRHAEALLEEIAGHSLQIAANREPPDWPGLVSYLTKKEISDNGN